MIAMASPPQNPEPAAMECPGCGCGHFEGGPESDYATCRFCGRRVRRPRVSVPAGVALEEAKPRKRAGTPGVDYFVLKCPYCCGRDVPAYKTAAPIRYHKCGGCGGNFKSVER